MGDAWASPARVAQILADPATRGSFTVVCTPVHGSVLRNNIRRCHRTSFRVPPAAARAIHVLADRPPFGIPVPTLPVLFTRRCRRMRFRGHQVPAWCSPNPFGRAACRRDCQVSAHSLRNIAPPVSSACVSGLPLGLPDRRPCRLGPAPCGSRPVGHSSALGRSPLRVTRLPAAITLAHALRRTCQSAMVLPCTDPPFG